MNCKIKSIGSLLPIAALLPLSALSSCTAGGSVPLARDLPSPPSFARAVRTADMRVGESCWIAYDRKRSGERQNASVIGKYNDWYAGVRKSYSGGAK